MFSFVVSQTALSAQVAEQQGLTGGFGFGVANWTFDGDQQSHAVGNLEIGYRIRLGSISGATFTVSPLISLQLSRFSGIKLDSDDVGFSSSELFGGQLAARHQSVRIYVSAHRSLVAIERYDNSNLVNYYGGVPSYALGVEFPRKNECGAGPTLSVRSLRGRLTQLETRATNIAPRDGRISATSWSLGWSGLFRGSRVLFRCH